jgi:A/G-specific adenine glycosylase
LQRLKGIGPYTASAVACFAYEQPVAMVDTNVRRVLSRVFDTEPAAVERMADGVIPPQAAWAWGQALMDLGATVCRSSRPLCLICPLLAECGGPRPHPRRRAVAGAGDFRSSNRYARGRILDELRGLPAGTCLAIGELAARVEGRADLIQALADDGLVAIAADGTVQLPE